MSSVNQTKKAIKALGMSVRHREGEWRVNTLEGTEATAYYTTSAEDALATAKAMKIGVKPIKAMKVDPKPAKTRRWYTLWLVKV